MSPLIRRALLALTFIICSVGLTAAELTFKGNPLEAIAVEPAANSGLTAVYVLNTVSGVRASYE